MEISVLPIGWDSSDATLKWRQNSEFQKWRQFCTITQNSKWRSEKVVKRRKMSKWKEMTDNY